MLLKLNSSDRKWIYGFYFFLYYLKIIPWKIRRNLREKLFFLCKYKALVIILDQYLRMFTLRYYKVELTEIRLCVPGPTHCSGLTKKKNLIKNYKPIKSVCAQNKRYFRPSLLIHLIHINRDIFGQQTVTNSNIQSDVAPSAQISLTLARHLSLLSIASSRSSGLHPVLAQSCCM